MLHHAQLAATRWQASFDIVAAPFPSCEVASDKTYVGPYCMYLKRQLEEFDQKVDDCIAECDGGSSGGTNTNAGTIAVDQADTGNGNTGPSQSWACVNQCLASLNDEYLAAAALKTKAIMAKCPGALNYGKWT